MVGRALTRKLVRDVWRTRGQALAICLVIGVGVAMFVGYFTTFQSLQLARQAYYDRFRFADVFVSLKRAPREVLDGVLVIPGVARAAPRVVMDVALDIPGMTEPASARLISLPAHDRPPLNEPFLRRGRRPERESEVLASEPFALANGFVPGNKLAATINGKRRELVIVGIALSPEYIYSIRPGELVPDNARFAILWMEDRALSAAFDMEGAFNDLSVGLRRDAVPDDVVAAVDQKLARYGSLGAVTRRYQLSNWFIENELLQLQTMGIIFPVIFLGVATMLLNIVLGRLIAVQREQIAALKALGYWNREIAWHYVSWALTVGLGGALAGVLFGMWLGRSMTNLYNDFFHFPMLRYVAAPVIVMEGTAISVIASGFGALGAVRRAMRLPPAEAMRPEPPARHTLTWLDRIVPKSIATPAMRMVIRNLSRQPLRTTASAFGMALAVAILVVGLFSLDSLDVILDTQFNIAHRQDYTIAFIEPRSMRALHEIEHLPGVLQVEPIRTAAARLRAGHRVRQIAITGLIDGSQLQRIIDRSRHPIPLPADGLVLSRKLADILRIREGDDVQVELLEGTRPTRTIRITGLADEFLGVGAYMEISALQRLMRTGREISGAAVVASGGRTAEFYRRIKDTPGIAAVSSTRAAIDNFRRTLAKSMNVLFFLNALFSSVIAFGVVYNSARISLSERGRELASLRVLGFTRAEVSAIFFGELAAILVVAVPAGLVLGYGIAALAIATLDVFNTELFRMPLVVSPRTYGVSAATAIIAAVASAFIVRRQLDQLDMIAVLKSRD